MGINLDWTATFLLSMGMELLRTLGKFRFIKRAGLLSKIKLLFSSTLQVNKIKNNIAKIRLKTWILIKSRHSICQRKKIPNKQSKHPLKSPIGRVPLTISNRNNTIISIPNLYSKISFFSTIVRLAKTQPEWLWWPI
jgi:hypothetical protein